MNQTFHRQQGFSLVEVIITLGVFSFAFVGLLGMFPVALEQSRNCVNETRSAQLARMVYATLATDDYEQAQCFGADTDPKLDLDQSPSVILYASYDVRNKATITRATSSNSAAPANAEYRLELSFVPPDASSDPLKIPDSPLRGTVAHLRILGEPKHNLVIFEGSEFISKPSRAVFTR